MRNKTSIQYPLSTISREKIMETSKTESRAEEVARVRGYLAAQAAKRNPAQILEALQEARTQFNEIVNSIADTDFYSYPLENEWNAAEVLEHVRLIALRDVETICPVLDEGKFSAGKDLTEVTHPKPGNAAKQTLLKAIEDLRERLVASVVKAEPEAHLDITWSHPEFGAMNWREWLLFARVHTLDHVRQLQKIATALNEKKA
jgi:DinB superfamily